MDPIHLLNPPQLIATLVIFTVIILIVHFSNKKASVTARQWKINEANTLMSHFLRNPTQESFEVVYKFLAVEEILLSETDKSITHNFIQYLNTHQVSQ